MKYAIGLDLGGTGIKYGLVSSQGTIIKECIRPTRLPGASTQGVKENVRDALIELRTFAYLNEIPLAGIGVGAAGIIYEGLVIGCEANLPEIEKFPLGQWLEGELGSPVQVENDANVMAIAEHSFGAAKGLSDAVFLTIGTGIGGALILNGSLYSGYRNRGTEMGHICVDLHGPVCTCGGRGCLEALASVEALIQDYKRRTHVPPELSATLDGQYITKHYLTMESAAVETMNAHFDYLSAGIATLINIFAPQKVIIGGGITESGDFYIREIASRAIRGAMREPAEFTAVRGAMLGNRAGFLGAASMCFTQNHP